MGLPYPRAITSSQKLNADQEANSKEELQRDEMRRRLLVIMGLKGSLKQRQFLAAGNRR